MRAVNFLRCGCPSVQVVIIRHSETEDKDAKHRFKVMFDSLEIDNEVFGEEELVLGGFTVLRLNRSKV